MLTTTHSHSCYFPSVYTCFVVLVSTAHFLAPTFSRMLAISCRASSTLLLWLLFRHLPENLFNKDIKFSSCVGVPLYVVTGFEFGLVYVCVCVWWYYDRNLHSSKSLNFTSPVLPLLASIFLKRKILLHFEEGVIDTRDRKNTTVYHEIFIIQHVLGLDLETDTTFSWKFILEKCNTFPVINAGHKPLSGQSVIYMFLILHC